MKIADIDRKIIGIYRILFPNGKSYIGLSNDIKRRIKEHYKDNRQPCIYNALQKYYSSEELIEFEILEEINSENYFLLSEKEKYWINKFSSNDKDKGYNLTPGGISLLSTNNPFAKFSEKQIEEIKQMLLSNDFSIREISEKFNCYSSTISKINMGKTYYDENINYPIKKEAKRLKGFENKNSIEIEKFEKIIELLKNSDKSIVSISEELNVSISECHRINQGKSHFQPNFDYPIRKSSKHRITKEEVEEIVSLLKEGDFSTTYIAKMFSCSRDTISDINTGKRHQIKGETYPIRTSYPKRRISKITKEPVSTILEAEEQDNY